MEQDELAAIRAARLNQIKQSAGNSPAGEHPDAEADSSKRQEADQMRRDVLASVLDSSARERREIH